MIRLARNLRLIPLVVLAAASLLALKTMGLVFDGGYALTGSQAARAAGRPQPAAGTPAPEARRSANQPPAAPAARGKPDWAEDLLAVPEVVTGTTAAKAEEAKPPAEKPGEKKPGAAAEPKKEPEAPKGSGGVSIDIDRPPLPPGERAVLESLNKRRQDLEARERELEMRDSLLKAQEKKLDAKLDEVKATETRINAALQKKDETEGARLKSLVTMYENMKPKDAARIFDRLDLRILVDVVGQINPRKMSDILGQMSAEPAEKLTTELATRGLSGGERGVPVGLPKIEGRPSTP
jgi:flagellar motility protein MotE (MotC chaperone)